MEWPAAEGPLEGLREDVVEVADEVEDPLAELIDRRERTPSEHAPNQDAEPDLDLVHPRAVLRREDEANLVGGILEEFLPTLHRVQNAVFALSAEVFADRASLGD